MTIAPICVRLFYVGLLWASVGYGMGQALEKPMTGLEGVFRIDGWGRQCSAFVIQNGVNKDDDLALTAAHCLKVFNVPNSQAPFVMGEWKGALTVVGAGTPETLADVAVLRGPIPEHLKALPISLTLPGGPFTGHFLGYRKTLHPVAIESAGPWGYVGSPGPRPGDSGGPLIANGVVYGVTYAVTEDFKTGFWVPLNVVHAILEQLDRDGDR